MGKDKRNSLGSISIEDGLCVDNLAVVLCEYFTNHHDRPANDVETENGWGEWVEKKTYKALDLIINRLDI